MFIVICRTQYFIRFVYYCNITLETTGNQLSWLYVGCCWEIYPNNATWSYRRMQHRSSDIGHKILNRSFSILDPEEHEKNSMHYFLHPVYVMDHPSCAIGPASQRVYGYAWHGGCSWTEALVFLTCANCCVSFESNRIASNYSIRFEISNIHTALLVNTSSSKPLLMAVNVRVAQSTVPCGQLLCLLLKKGWVLVCPVSRAPIDRPISRESSSSPNLEQYIQCVITNTYSCTMRPRSEFS